MQHDHAATTSCHGPPKLRTLRMRSRTVLSALSVHSLRTFRGQDSRSSSCCSYLARCRTAHLALLHTLFVLDRVAVQHAKPYPVPCPYPSYAVRPGHDRQDAVGRQPGAEGAAEPHRALGVQPALVPDGAAAGAVLPAGACVYYGRACKQCAAAAALTRSCCCSQGTKPRPPCVALLVYNSFCTAALAPSYSNRFATCPPCAHPSVQILAKAHATTARMWALAAALAVALIAFAVRAVVSAMAGAPVAA